MLPVFGAHHVTDLGIYSHDATFDPTELVESFTPTQSCTRTKLMGHRDPASNVYLSQIYRCRQQRVKTLLVLVQPTQYKFLV